MTQFDLQLPVIEHTNNIIKFKSYNIYHDVVNEIQGLIQRPKYSIHHQLLVIECEKRGLRERKRHNTYLYAYQIRYRREIHLSLQWLVLHFQWVPGCQHLGFLHPLSKAIEFISYHQLIFISHVFKYWRRKVNDKHLKMEQEEENYW